MSLAPERQRLVALMATTVSDQAAHGNWTYAAVRPQPIIATYTGQHVEADCSDGVRDLARVAGVKDDPAGTGYAPYGNSSSIWAHLPHVALEDVEPGDVGTFGYSTGEHHACMFWEKYGPGRFDWWVWNHGAPGQPVKSQLMDEIAGHSGMTLTCCRLGVTDPAPTAADVLRAKTGFYSWVAWRLGEGPWRKYGKANKLVRPAVPKVIPLRWWREYRAFLAARRKANP